MEDKDIGLEGKEYRKRGRNIEIFCCFMTLYLTLCIKSIYRVYSV